MDPSIMKLLEDDEDESMHSGADLEAFTAALNRDIGGDPSVLPQPADADPGRLPQGSSSQSLGQWQASGQDENHGMESDQRGEQQHWHQTDQQSSQAELAMRNIAYQIQHGDSKAEQQLLQSQQEQSRSELQLPQPGTSSSFQLPEKEQTHNADQSIVGSKQGITQLSESQKQHMQQHTNQLPPPASQAGNATTMRAPSSISFNMLIPILQPQLDKDRSMQLTAIWNKLRSNQVSKENFLRVVRNIVGDQMLKQAAHKVQMQVQAQAARNLQTNPNRYSLLTQASAQQLSSGSRQFPDQQAFPHHSMPSNQISKGSRSPPRHPYAPPSTAQMQTNASYTNFNNNSENKDVKGLHVPQTRPVNMIAANAQRDLSLISAQDANKQQLRGQPPQTSVTMYGSSSLQNHTYPRPLGATMASHRPQSLDSHARQSPHAQGVAPSQAGAVSIRPSLQHGSAAWQLSANKELKASVFPPMAYVKQEVGDPPVELLHKPQLGGTESSSFSLLPVKQGNPALGSVRDETSEKQPSSTSTNLTSASQISAPQTTQAEPSMQFSSTPAPVAGASMKTPQKKSTTGQKKPLETPGSSPPPSSKKQKTSGAFLDQSIEQLNDVTAVSGVNLREEEEQLLCAPKEESRISEAARRAVLEEEERLILLKGPLQKKLVEIMSNCNVKSVNSDVERCLSMCVEERLRGLIGQLIRFSKQRVDIEKGGHRFAITSDVRRHILQVNRKSREEWDKKQAEEAEKLRKQSEVDGNAGVDSEREKDEGRSKNAKANKEEDDKMRTTAANVAARAAVGGDDMLSKWQLMAEQARQKREGLDLASGSQSGKAASHKSLTGLGRGSREYQESEKKGSMRRMGRRPLMGPSVEVARKISVKDVIAVLEREPQMSKSPLIYRLYERLSGDSVQ